MGNNKNTICWIILVLLLSFLCYIPMLLQKHGIYISRTIINIKYLFVILPYLITIVFEIHDKNLKKWLVKLFNFSNITFVIIISGAIAIIGLSSSIIYSLIGNRPSLFIDSYPEISSVIGACIYLFVMALFEEMAWRGYLLNKLLKENHKFKSLVCVGMVWGLWHIPMWVVRNSLEIEEIIYFLIWTFLVSVVLGVLYIRWKNIWGNAFLHMIFNVSFIAPIKYNIFVLAITIAVMYLVYSRNTERLL